MEGHDRLGEAHRSRGLELARERLDRRNYQLDANPALAGVQAPTSFAAPRPDPSTTLDYTKTPNLNALADGDTVAVYAQDQLEFSPEWKALFGLRYEHFKSSARSPLSATPPRRRSGPFSRTDDMLSGRAGVIWQPTNCTVVLRFVGQLVQSVRRARRLRRNRADNLNAINQNLDPEKSQNYEVGAQWDLRRACRCARRSSGTRRPTRACPTRSTGFTVLEGKRRVDGIEFEATGSITRNWDIYSGIAFMDGEIVTGPAERRARRRSAWPTSPATSGRSTASAADGRSAAACADRRAHGSRTRISPAPRFRATSSSTRRSPTCRSNTRFG